LLLEIRPAVRLRIRISAPREKGKRAVFCRFAGENAIKEPGDFDIPLGLEFPGVVALEPREPDGRTHEESLDVIPIGLQQPSVLREKAFLMLGMTRPVIAGWRVITDGFGPPRFN
jgi:hypothetical protein